MADDDLICLDGDDDDVVAYPTSKYDSATYDEDIFVADDDDGGSQRKRRRVGTRDDDDDDDIVSIDAPRNESAEAMKRRIEAQLGLARGRNYSTGTRSTRSSAATTLVEPVQLDSDDDDGNDESDDDRDAKRKMKKKKKKKRKRKKSYSSSASSSSGSDSDDDFGYNEALLLNAKEVRQRFLKSVDNRISSARILRLLKWKSSCK